jgi:hypothetical protein
MSISSVSNNFQQLSGLQAGGTRHADRTQARQALGDALASGDLDAAKAAFDKFAALKSPDAGQAHPDGAFAKLKAAMASGDLPAAQAAYAKLPAFRVHSNAGHSGDQGIAAQTGNGTLASEGSVGTMLNVVA